MSITRGNVYSGGSGMQNLFQVLTVGNDGGGLSIANVPFLIDSAAKQSYDVDLRSIIDATGLVYSIRGDSRLLQDSSGQNAVDWENRLLIDTALITSMDFSSRSFYDSLTIISGNWENRLLNDSTSVISIDWEGRRLKDIMGNDSLNYDYRQLYDSSLNGSIDYETHILYDSVGGFSLNYGTRSLVGSDSTSIPLTWDDTNITIKSGAVLINEDHHAAPALAGAPPVFTDFYGGDTNALGDPSDWMPVVLNGVPGVIPFYAAGT
jgi:hypothetical protein